MKKLVIALGILVVGGLGAWHFVSARAETTTGGYQFVEVKRGNLESVVSGTGTIDALGTVDVGTQVSGTIKRIFVDFNDRVKKDQLIAVLDTNVLEATVRDAQANVARTLAQYEQAKADNQRNLSLFQKGFLSVQEFTMGRTSAETAEASCQSAQAALDRAKTNLKYAEIRSPIDGTVIQRNVEEGQTVAASLQAPTLFVIAEDLAKMEILGLVDESDIGQIREGQDVRFTVQAYPEKPFSGTVRQIRLQPQTIQNVVNYTVVINAENAQGLLMPGMTATVDFVVQKVENALLVPSAALRFQPSEEAMAKFRERQQRHMGAVPDSARERMRAEFAGRGGVFGGAQGGGGKAPPNVGRLWYLDGKSQLAMARVRTGATDGLMTEITMGRDVQEGMRVISGITPGSGAAKAAPSQPNQQRSLFGPQGRPPGGGPPGRF